MIDCLVEINNFYEAHKFTLIFIDESECYNNFDSKEQEEINSKINEIASLYKIPILICPLHEIYFFDESGVKIKENENLNIESKQKLKKLLENVKDNTAKEDLIKYLRSALISIVARENQLKSVFFWFQLQQFCN